MNAFELTMILANLKSNNTKYNVKIVLKDILNRSYDMTLFSADVDAMKLLLEVLDICNRKVEFGRVLSLIKHRLHKELHDSVLDSSTGLKAQRAT